MLIEIPPKISAPSFIGYLKENSSTMINEQLDELKYKIQEPRIPAQRILHV